MLSIVPKVKGKVVKSGLDVVKRLEEALKIAKKGGIDNCAIILTYNSGDVGTCWANGNSAFSMIGAIETVKQDFTLKNTSRMS